MFITVPLKSFVLVGKIFQFSLAIFVVCIYNKIMLNEYFNYLYNYDAQASGLLGSIDNQNNYRIEDDLKEELLKANKLITDYKEDLITCYASVGAYKFDFKVLIQEGEGHKKRAGLFLIEKATQGFYENEVQTLIHYMILPNDGAFIDTVKTTFHLFTRDESEGVDMANANTERRNTANNVYITINAAILAIVTFTLDYKSILLSIVGILICALWIKTIRSYTKLSKAKYDIVNEIEKKLPLQPFTCEWKELNKVGYIGLTKIEFVLPIVFIVLFAIAIVFPFFKAVWPCIINVFGK
jgi:hypothetical protein